MWDQSSSQADGYRVVAACRSVTAYSGLLSASIERGRLPPDIPLAFAACEDDNSLGNFG
jgi:hypothetical protein